MRTILILFCLFWGVGAAWPRNGDPIPSLASVDKPVNLIQNGDFSQDLADRWIGDGAIKPKISVIDAEVGRFNKAVRLECAPDESGQPWQTGFGQRCTTAVRKDDAVYFRAWMRSPDRVRVAFIYESVPGFIKAILQQVRLTPEWKEYRFMGQAFQDFQSGQSQAKWWLGYDTGAVELAGVRVENYGLAPNDSFDQTFDYWAGREHSDAWRPAALDRIETLRKGTLVIRVFDADGKPMPDAQVKLEQKRHYFRFGTEACVTALVDTQDPDKRRFQQEVARLFNTVTFGDDLKWQAIDWGLGDGGKLTTANRAVDWCKAHGIDVRGHCLLWGSYGHLPVRARNLRGDALLEACRSHVTDYVTRMKGRLYLWDVVNEAGGNVEVWDEIGWKNFADAFRWARAADPDVKLCYNDYAIIDDDRYYTKKAAERIQFLLDNDAPVDVLGIQAHMRPPLVPMPLLLERLDQWAAYGKELEITEYDLACLDDKIHGEYMRDILTAAFSHPRMKSFIMWGFWEGLHWIAKDGGAMFRRDWSKRPAAEAYEELVLNQWWTRWQGSTGTDGSASLRAFYGLHGVSARAGNHTASTTIELKPGGPATVELHLKLD